MPLTTIIPAPIATNQDSPAQSIKSTTDKYPRTTSMIVASAVWHEYQIFTGKRHHDAIANAVKALGNPPVIGQQGFVDEHGVFYSRIKAADHAILHGQITREKMRHKLNLYSEDLW